MDTMEWNEPFLDYLASLKMRIPEPSVEEIQRHIPKLERLVLAQSQLQTYLSEVMNLFEFNLWSGWLHQTWDKITFESCFIHQTRLLRLIADGVLDLMADPQFDFGRTAAPPVSVIVPAWNQWAYTRDTLSSLFSKTVWPEYEVIVIDNGSEDDTPAELKILGEQERRLRVIRNRINIGFSGANNQGVEAASHDHIVFLNNDMMIHHEDWIGQMMRTFLSHPRVGATGQFAVYDWFVGDRQDFYQKVFFPGYVVPVSWISGYNILTSKKALADAGGWRGDLYGPAGYEDIHLGYALRQAGWLCVAPYEVILIRHLIGKTRFTESGKTFVDAHSPLEDKHRIFCRHFGSRRHQSAARPAA